MNRKELFKILLSFLTGSIITILLIKSGVIDTSNTIIKNGTHIYEKNSLAPAIEKIYDAVVEIESYEKNTPKNNGTGFIYKTDNKYGYILTNEHVIQEYTNIVVINSKEEEINATVLGKDKCLDLAVIVIDKKYVNQVATIGKSKEMNLGDTVFTVGSPLGGTYRGSVTAGILSGKDRMVTTIVSENDNTEWVMKVLQVDASINPGNSGGPLLNANGEVVGVCSLKLVKENIEGMGFAIPIEFAMSHINTLESGTIINWPVLGISMINVIEKESLMSNNINISEKIKEGVVVKAVKEGKAAEKAGLQVGDVIIKIDEVQVKNIAFLRYELYQHQVGDKITVTYIRDGKERKAKVKLTADN